MSDFIYLKDKQHYIDLYDFFTVKECLRVIETWRKIYKEKSNDKEISKLSDKEKLENFSKILNIHLYVAKGEEYRKKQETIDKWIEADRIKQDKYSNTRPPNIICSDCKAVMHSTMKHLEDYTNEPLRVLFFFDCPSCKKRKCIYESGEEKIFKPNLCPKCKNEIQTKQTKKGNVINWATTCSSCKFTETKVDDFEKSHAEWENKQQGDKQLLEKYREEFCLTDKQGQEYIEYSDKMEVANEVKEQERRKYDNSVYEKTIRSKKISIVQLEKLLSEILEKESYIKLSFDMPEISQFVIVPFTAQDSESSRKEHVSTSNLEKIIKTFLEGTNWRLMSEGINYRLGYVSGRLKGYEREEDLIEINGKKQGDVISKVDPAKMAKYANDPLVSVYRMLGKSEAIENLRKKRLVHEPDGFALEENEGTYNCRVCSKPASGKNAWWDLSGIKCLDCQRNIKEGVIPTEICQDDDIWIKEWQFNSDFSIHAGTVKRLRREGLLHGRELKTESGTVYYTVYLIEENKEFLDKYPRKPKMKMTYSDPQGREIKM